MSSIQQGGNLPQTTTATPADQAATPQITAEEALTSLPHLNLDANAVQKDVNALLQRAGLERTTDGALQIKDTASINKSGEVKDLSAAEQIYAAGETQLKPPGPPKIEMTKELQKGAETFANNLDAVFNEALPKLAKLQNSVKLELSGVEKGVIDSAATHAAKEGVKAQVAAGSVNEHLESSGIKGKVMLGDDLAAKAGVVTGKEGAAGTKEGANTPIAQAATGTGQVNQATMQRLAELSADVLLAAFLKLNITDPNNSVETHNLLHEIMTRLRQKGIEDARAKIKAATEAKKEAEAYAEQAQYISTVISVVMIVVTLIITCLTMGAGAMLFVAVAMAIGAMIGAMSGGAEGALQGASIAGSIASFGAGAAVQAGAQTAKEIANQIVKQLVNMVKNMAKNLAKMMTKMFEEGAKTAAEMSAEAAKNVSQEVVQKLTEQTLARAKEIATKELKDLSQSQVQEVMKQASKEIMAESQTMIEQEVQKVVDEVVQEAAKQGKEITAEAAKELKEELTKSVTNEIQKMAQEGAIASIERGVMSQSTGRLIQTGANAAGEVVKGGANMTANEKLLDSQQLSIEAKRMRMLAEMMQNQLEDEAEMVKIIMESKNQMVDAVIKMMNAMFASSQKLMSAGMAK